MNEHDFITWLRGFVKTNDTPTEEQWDIIKKKLDFVFELPIKPYEPYPWDQFRWHETRGPTVYWTDSTCEDDEELVSGLVREARAKRASTKRTIG